MKRKSQDPKFEEEEDSELLCTGIKRQHRQHAVPQQPRVVQPEYLLDVRDGDLTLILGSSCTVHQPPRIRVCSQVMSNASTNWRDALKTAAVLGDGKMFLVMEETDIENFIFLCQLIHFQGSIKRPLPNKLRMLAKLSVKHGCQKAIKGLMFLWFNLYLISEDLKRGDEWVLLYTSLDFQSKELFYTMTGRIISDLEPWKFQNCRSYAYDPELSRQLFKAVMQNRRLLENHKSSTEDVGLCLKCFEEVRNSRGRKNYVSHLDLSKCA